MKTKIALGIVVIALVSCIIAANFLWPATARLNPSITLDPTSGPAGTSVKVLGKNWWPQQPAWIMWNGSENNTVAQATPDAKGTFQTSFVVPEDSIGIHTVRATSPSYPGFYCDAQFNLANVPAVPIMEVFAGLPTDVPAQTSVPLLEKQFTQVRHISVTAPPNLGLADTYSTDVKADMDGDGFMESPMQVPELCANWQFDAWGFKVTLDNPYTSALNDMVANAVTTYVE